MCRNKATHTDSFVINTEHSLQASLSLASIPNPDWSLQEGPQGWSELVFHSVVSCKIMWTAWLVGGLLLSSSFTIKTEHSK
jgi:hypothetical protein